MIVFCIFSKDKLILGKCNTFVVAVSPVLSLSYIIKTIRYIPISGGQNKFSAYLKHMLKENGHMVATVESNQAHSNTKNVFTWVRKISMLIRINLLCALNMILHNCLFMKDYQENLCHTLLKFESVFIDKM